MKSTRYEIFEAVSTRIDAAKGFFKRYNMAPKKLSIIGANLSSTSATYTLNIRISELKYKNR